MLAFPGSHALHGRAAYYRSEAARIEALAAAAQAGEGRECFMRVAQEYRGLAARLMPAEIEDEEDPAAPGDGATASPQ